MPLGSTNDPFRVPSASKLNVVITLVCGHKRRSRTPPYSPRVKFSCPINAPVDGYNITWASWTDGPNQGTNSMVEQPAPAQDRKSA